MKSTLSKSDNYAAALKECLAMTIVLVEHLDSEYRNQNSKLEAEEALKFHDGCMQIAKYLQSSQEALKGIEALFEKLAIP